MATRPSVKLGDEKCPVVGRGFAGEFHFKGSFFFFRHLAWPLAGKISAARPRD